jgi:hypothetical protein
MIRLLGQMIAQAIAFVFFFVFLGMVAGWAHGSIEAAGGLHWLAGLVVGVLWVVGAFALLVGISIAMRPSAAERLRRYFLIQKKEGDDAGLAEQYPTASLLALICVAMLVAVFAMAGISTILESREVFAYTPSGSELPQRELLFRLYLWHVVDLIPLVQVWQIYDIPAPIQPDNVWSQTAVLVFRTAIVSFAIAVITQAVAFYREQR